MPAPIRQPFHSSFHSKGRIWGRGNWVLPRGERGDWPGEAGSFPGRSEINTGVIIIRHARVKMSTRACQLNNTNAKILGLLILCLF